MSKVGQFCSKIFCSNSFVRKNFVRKVLYGKIGAETYFRIYFIMFGTTYFTLIDVQVKLGFQSIFTATILI
jgi:hypothetical protein